MPAAPSATPLLTCLLSPVRLAQNGSYFILLRSGIQGHWECRFNHIHVVFPVANSERVFVFLVF